MMDVSYQNVGVRVVGGKPRLMPFRRVVRTFDDWRLFQQLRRRGIPTKIAVRDFIGIKSSATTYQSVVQQRVLNH